MKTIYAALAYAIDRPISRFGMGLFYHPAQAAWLDAWTDEQGAFTLRLGRFEFVRD